jgi:ribonuclease HII
MSKLYLKPKYELELIDSGEYDYVVGIDEVGRGCLAGPVAVGGYLFRPENKVFRKVNDSKLIKMSGRVILHKKLSEHDYMVKYGDNAEIDKIGIGKVLHNLISTIVIEFQEQLNSERIFFLIDGQFSKNFGINTKKVIKGDSTYYSIASASILAKVERDNLMIQMHKLYPVYRFDKHKGYATKFHREIIKNLGISEIHRKSFLTSPNLSLFE